MLIRFVKSCKFPVAKSVAVITTVAVVVVVLLFVYLFVYKNPMETFKAYTEKSHDDIRSSFQRIEIATIKAPTNIGKCMILDGEVQLCSKDEHKYHELMVHFPVYYLDSFQRALVVGGGDLMNLREIMKYDTIKSAIVLELDREVVMQSVINFGVNTYKNDPRVSVRYGDAMDTIDTVENKKMDLIILDLTEDSENNIPVGSVSFIETCKRKLSPKGVLVMNGKANEEKLKSVFNYVYRYGCYLKTFEEFYEFVICSDVHDFPEIKKGGSVASNIQTNFYDRAKHRSYFNWYSVSQNT